MSKPTVDQIRALLVCDAATGRLIWKARTPDMFEDGDRPAAWRCRNWNSRYAGREAGHLTKDGYRTVRIFDHAYLAHHVIWAIVHGEWPDQLDHRDGVEVGDGIGNLRKSSQSENMQNARKRSDNTSGFKGVSWDDLNGKWVARIRVPGGKYENLGRFNAAEKAHKAYCQRATELFGQFARFG